MSIGGLDASLRRALVSLTVAGLLVGCAWQRVPAAPSHVWPQPIPMDIGVEFSGTPATQTYGPPVLAAFKEMNLFRSITYPYRDGDPVDAKLYLSIEGSWRTRRGASFWAGFWIGATLGILSPVLGPSMAADHQVEATLSEPANLLAEYEARVRTTVKWGLMANTNEVAAKADNLQIRRIAFELANEIQADRDRLLAARGRRPPSAPVPATREPHPGEAEPSAVVEQLRQLEELWRSGALTDDEFEKAKARILAD